jgi:RNA polymerase sigma-70 factor (ECF subfamily)
LNAAKNMNQASGTLLPDDVPDMELARRIGAEDRDALRLLIRRHHRLLYRTACCIVKDDREAEDAVQDAYMRAYQGIGGYRGQAKLSTWLVRIVVNESLARLRRRKRTREVIPLDGEIAARGADGVFDPHNDPAHRPDAHAMRAQARHLIERSIEALPSTFRTVFLMRAVEEMSVEETAAALKIPPSTVRTRYFRARGLLRESLAPVR